MKKQIIILIVSAAMGTTGFSQSTYKSAIGARIGSTYYDLISASFKTFISKPGAIELNLGFGSRGYFGYGNTATVSFAGSYQHHFDIPKVPGLKWFVGGGATVYNAFSDYDAYKGLGFGVFATGGVDYKIARIPLNVSADVRPTINITRPGYYNSFYGNYGVAARYTLR
ncbi:MAG: hypothetical protein ABIX01_11410 [Chitinophagaceae bacterium]